MKKFKLLPVVLILVTALLIGCSEDDKKKSSITEFNYMDKEQNDYVLFVRNNGQGERSANQVCFAVIKENGFLDEVYLNYEGVQYELQNLAAGKIWSCEELAHLAEMQGTTISLTVKGYKEDELMLDQTFDLDIVNFTCECNWPETICEEVVEENGYVHFEAIDSELNWDLAGDNEYQLIWINQSECYDLKKWHRVLDKSCRGCCLEADCFTRDPEDAVLTLTQMNTFQNERFLAISIHEISKDYGDPDVNQPSIMAEIQEIVKTIR